MLRGKNEEPSQGTHIKHTWTKTSGLGGFNMGRCGWVVQGRVICENIDDVIEQQKINK